MSAWLDRSPAWQRASSRERALVVLGGLVVALALGWALVWQPVTRDLEQSASTIALERAALDRARQQANDIAAIPATPARPAVDLRSAVERAFAQRGLAGSVEARDGGVRVVLTAARFDALVAALGTLASESGIRVAAATLSPRVEPGTVRAELSLVR